MGLFSWLFGSGTDETPTHTPPPVPPSKKSSAALDGGEIAEIARRRGVSTAAVETLATAMQHSGGRSAQFNHPELGGMGQWMSGGMLMIGDMFNHDLKARVDAMCRDVASAIVRAPITPSHAGSEEASWWPQSLGVPAWVGSQNAMRYAYFPTSKRLVVDDNGSVSTYDTEHRDLTGFAQQQSSHQTLSFTDAVGRVVRLENLKRL